MIRSIFVTLLGLCLLVGTPVTSAAADAMLADIQRTYDTMQRFSGDFIQELQHLESGAVERREGVLVFEKPLRIRWETKAPFPELLLATDNEVWDYLPDEEVAYRYGLDVVKDSSSILKVVTGQSRLDTDFDVEREADRDGLIVYRLYPKNPTTQLVEAVLQFEPSTKLLRQADIVDFYGNTNRITFTKLTPNVNIPANAFRFTPPDGISVEDRRGQAMEQH